MASTHMEALIAEMLGDVGKLHDELKGLAGVIPAQTQALEEHMAPLVGAMNAASERIMERCKQLTASATQAAKDAHDQRAREVASHYVGAIGKEAQRVAGEAIHGPIKGAVAHIEQAAQAVASTARVFRGNVLVVVGLVVVGGAIAGFFGGVGYGLAKQHIDGPTLTAQQEQDMAIGHNVRAAWPSLSSNTKAEVQRALRTQAQ